MPQSSHADALEVELIRTLFESRVPAFIMSAGFLAVGSLTVWQTGDRMLAMLLAAGIATSLGRVALMVMRSPEARAAELTPERARHLQQRFTLAYFSFAVVLGLFGGRMMQLSYPELHMLTICMLVGYGAGVAAGVGLRPRIAIPSMIVATVPMITLALVRSDVVYWTMAVLTAGFLVGGINSVRMRYARAVRSIGRRITFSALARQDGLTELPNRLALREWFDERVTCADKPGMAAVHYLDLNGFKPINDRFGHPVGDALLVAVSGRIERTIRATDMAARFGGDEFAVVQCGIANADEAALLAQRLATAIAKPYQIEGNTIRISTCVGYVVSERGEEDLEHLLHAADEALYASKRAGGGVTRWLPAREAEQRAAA